MELRVSAGMFFSYSWVVCSGRERNPRPRPLKHLNVFCSLWCWADCSIPMIDCEMNYIPLWFHSQIYLGIRLVHPPVSCSASTRGHPGVWYKGLPGCFYFSQKRKDRCSQTKNHSQRKQMFFPLHPHPHSDSHPPSLRGHLEVICLIPRCPGTAAASASGRGERTSVFSESDF